MTDTIKNPEHGDRTLLTWYFALTYGLLLTISQGSLNLEGAREAGWSGLAILLDSYVVYAALYLVPAILLTRLAGSAWLWRHLGKPHLARPARLTTAVLAGGLTTLFIHASVKLYSLYGMFVNGFVINLLTTPGGIESLGGSQASQVTFALVALSFFALQAALLLGLRWMLARWPALQTPWRTVPLASVFGLALLGDWSASAYHSAFGRTEILALQESVPYHVKFSMDSTFRKLGFQGISIQPRQITFRGKMHYPAHPIAFQKPAKPYNIVWLVSESWRADTLNPEIMPNTTAFAAQAQNFLQHYSGGNGTRIGVFTMMTGIPDLYWKPFMEAGRNAPILDVLRAQDYQMAFYTSAAFSYPEFDKTIFSQIPREWMHEIPTQEEGWVKDRKNVSDMLEFIAQRDPQRPFFTWMFFESPHARYYFPPESVIKRPYRDDINYATLSRWELRQDMPRIKNRYLNAVHHLDSQFDRVIRYLRENKLLDSTIVVMLGDHGEEFMEQGFWGHNSSFSDPQTRTPLVLWVPGLPAAQHHALTSHLDVSSTLMPLLGVKNPTSDYAIGMNLLDMQPREYVVLSDWSHIGYRDATVKITLPLNAKTSVGKKITGPHDELLPADRANPLFKAEQPHLQAMMRDIGRFSDQPL